MTHEEALQRAEHISHEAVKHDNAIRDRITKHMWLPTIVAVALSLLLKTFEPINFLCIAFLAAELFHLNHRVEKLREGHLDARWAIVEHTMNQKRENKQ